MKKKKILIADDVIDMLERKRTILNRASFEIFTAKSGYDALAVHREHNVDLMILSLDLKDISGDRLCSLIRKEKELKHVSVVLTCADEPASIERAVRCGANAFVTRPFHSGQLTEQVTKLLSIPQRQSYRVLLKAAVKGECTHNAFFCSSRDISATGLMIETEKSLAQGSVLACSFFLAGYGHIHSDGEVVRVDTRGATPLYGIRFRSLDPQHRQAITSFVAARAAAKL